MSGSGRHTVLATVALRLLVLGIAFVSNVLVSRDLGPDGRGSYQLALVLAAFLATVAGLAGEQGATELYARTHGGRDRVVQTAIAVSVLVGMPAAALSSGLGAVGAFGLAPELWWLTGIYAWSVTQTTWLQRLLIMTNLARTAGVVSAVEALLFMLGVAVLLHQGALTPMATLGVACAVGVVSACLSWWALGIQPQHASHATARQTLHTGVRYYPGQVGLQLLMRMDVLLLGALVGSAAVGLYAVAVAITGPLSVIGTALGTTLMNQQLVAGQDETATSTLGMVRGTSLVLLPLTLVIAAVVPVIVPLVWGRDFTPSVGVTWALLPGMFFSSVQRPVGTYFVAGGHAWAANVRVAFSVVVSAIGCFLLIPLWGPVGAAVSASLGMVVYFGISLWAFSRLSGVPRSELLRALIFQPREA